MPNEPSATSRFLNGCNKAGKLTLLSQNRIERGPYVALRNTLTGRVHKPQFQETTQPPEVTPQPSNRIEGFKVNLAWRFVSKSQLPKQGRNRKPHLPCSILNGLPLIRRNLNFDWRSGPRPDMLVALSALIFHQACPLSSVEPKANKHVAPDGAAYLAFRDYAILCNYMQK